MTTNSINDVGLKHIWDKIVQALSNKVDKITGKGLSTNDYTTEEKNKLADIDISGRKEVSGNPISISDGSETYADELSVDLEPIQDLHGYDKPWVGGAGKNLLPMTVEGIKAANTGGTWNGNVYTINGGTITILTDSDENVTGIKANGTFTSALWFSFGVAFTISAGTYTLSGAQSNLQLHGEGGTSFANWVATGTSDNPQKTFSSNATGRFYLRVLASTISNVVVQPQIELGTAKTSFEQYQNFSPITGYTEVDVDRCGKNLFGGIDFTNALHDGSNTSTIDTTNKTVTFNRRKTTNTILFDDFKPNTTYTIILTGNVNTSGEVNNSLFINGSEGASYFRFENTTKERKTIVYTGTVNNLSLGWQAAGLATLYYDECGIFEGEILATDFEPYKGTSLTIPLGRTVYGSTVDVANGEMVVNRKIWDATISLTSYSHSTTGIVMINDFYTLRDIWNDAVISDSYAYQQPQDGSVASWLQYGRMTKVSGYNYLYIRNEDFKSKTLSEIKTIIEANQFVYELATPITIPLTPQQLKLLKGQNYISSNGTTINLTYQPDNVVGDGASLSENYIDRAIDGKQDRDIGNYSRNLVFQTITGASVNSSGKVISNSAIDLHIAKVEQGVAYTATEDRTPINNFTCGFFTEIPQVGSTTYNEGRYSDVSPTFISPISGYAAFWTNTGYETPMLEIGLTKTAYEPYIPTNAELYEMIKALQNS